LVKYSRLILKLSGEAISGVDNFFDIEIVNKLAKEIRKVHELGVQIGIVIGGGNIIRGESLSKTGLDRNQSDYMGMLATVINSLFLEQLLNKEGVDTVVQSALPIDTVVESINLKKSTNYLDSGRVIIFAAGTGSPHFTTDTAAA